jgi:hypothetical protein
MSLTRNLNSQAIQAINEMMDKDKDEISLSDDEIDSDDESSEENLENINKEFDPLTFFNSKELCYFKMISKFYKLRPKEEISKMIRIINSESEISLRVLDWFVTRYSKRRFEINMGNGVEIFDVHISYKSQLKSYKKRYFDPFRRRKKFYYQLIENDSSSFIITTLGQLNFFRWAITNNIISFVEDHLIQVTKAMNISNKKDKQKKEQKRKKDKDDNMSDKSTDSKKKRIEMINKIKKQVEEHDEIIINFD